MHLKVELLCKAGSPLVSTSRLLSRGNNIADALDLPRLSVVDVVVDQLHTEPEARWASRNTELDIVAVEVPAGFGRGSMVKVQAVSGEVTARVPNSCRPGDVFLAEYHPVYSQPPAFRLTFQILQSFDVDAGPDVQGQKIASGQCPVDLGRELRRRLDHANCGVTHASVHFADSACYWGEECDVLEMLWSAAEQGDLGLTRRVLSSLQSNGWLRTTIDRAGPISGCTALHLAARWNHVEVLQELLVRGCADCAVKDEKGRTPEALARQMGHWRAVCLYWRGRRRLGGAYTVAQTSAPPYATWRPVRRCVAGGSAGGRARVTCPAQAGLHNCPAG